MSDLISAIADDIEEYEALCELYEEKVHYKPDAYGHLHPDCYGYHCHKLQERRLKEAQEKEQNKRTVRPRKKAKKKPMSRYDIIKRD